VKDETEEARRLLIESGAIKLAAEVIEATGRKTWTTEEFKAEFEMHALLAPIVYVTRKADGVKGTLMFRHHPRLYFAWQEGDELDRSIL
jgi:hypothetical protein